ncbi:hypothetical protein ILUMI_17108, partial [Ignelater luminosus]
LNEWCETPDGETGKCVPITSCQVIQEATLTQNATAIRFAQDSQCGHDGTHLVCCGDLGYTDPNIDYLFSIFHPEVSEVKSPEIKKDDKTLKNLNSKELPDRSVCGIQSSEDKIYGGNRTAPDEFPWMVALEFKNVITGQDGITYVRLGEWKLSSDPDCEDCEPVQKVRIAKIISYPFYDSKTKNNDIALLLLEKEITFT